MSAKYREIDENPYIPVRVDSLIVGEGIPCEIFLQDKGIVKSLFNKGTVFSSSAKAILDEDGISEVYIRRDDSSDFESVFKKNNPKKTLSPDDTVPKEYFNTKEQYFQIDKSLLIPGLSINFSLFFRNEYSFIPIAEVTATSPIIVDSDIAAVAHELFIKRSDTSLYYDYITCLIKPSVSLQEISEAVRAIAIKEDAKITVKDILEAPRSGEKVKRAKDLVTAITSCILEKTDIIYDMLTLKSYDYYTYTHSVNVAVLSIGLGASIRMDRDQLEHLGIGALLHDLGKSAVPPAILNKQGRLNTTEYFIIQSHVIDGEQILREHKDIHEESFTAVLQHHEKLTGKGYPLKLKGDAIKLFGRITAIADCYDALTTQRPYRHANTPFYALSILSREVDDYDPELLKVFIKMLGKIK